MTVPLSPELQSLLENLESLTPEQKARVARKFGPLTHKQQDLVEAYCEQFDASAAAETAGYTKAMADRLLDPKRSPNVAAAVEEVKAVRSEASALKAEYVRDYIHSILEVCPTDFFVLAPDGDWVVDPEEFRRLPQQIKRLVTKVTVKIIGRQRFYSVEFVSKEMALNLAAKFTLVQKVEANLNIIPWDQIPAAPSNDAIEERLAVPEA